jgi:hypothetical protein
MIIVKVRSKRLNVQHMDIIGCVFCVGEEEGRKEGRKNRSKKLNE